MLDDAFPEIRRGLRAYCPELIVVAAGFDAHEKNPMQSRTSTDSDYYAIASICVRWQASGKDPCSQPWKGVIWILTRARTKINTWVEPRHRPL